MFDISTINKRYFSIKIKVDSDDMQIDVILDVEPPKLKALRKITSLAKVRNEESMDNLAEAIKMILDKNKTGYKVPEDVIDELDFDQMEDILKSYFGWLSTTRNSSPN